MTLGAFISSSGAGFFAKWLGRRHCLWLASILCCASNVIMMTTTNLSGLYAGRFLIGLANGWYMTFAQLYIQVRLRQRPLRLTHAKQTQESTPARYRGLMISVFQSWTSIGTLVGTVVDNGTHALPGKTSYLIPLGIIYIVPVCMSLGLFFIPESPRWLVLVERNAEARKSLLWMRPQQDAVDAELEQIHAAILAEKEAASSASFIYIVRNPVDRRRTLLAIAAVSIQAASGAMFIIAYGTSHPRTAPLSVLHTDKRPYPTLHTPLFYPYADTKLTSRLLQEPTSSKWPTSATPLKTRASSPASASSSSSSTAP